MTNILGKDAGIGGYPVNVEKQTPYLFEKIPQLLDLYVNTDIEKLWCEKLSENNSKATEVEREVNEAFEPEQAEKIKQCCRQILLSHFNPSQEQESPEINENRLSLDLALRMVLLESSEQNSALSDQCFNVLSEKLPRVKIEFNKKGLLEIKITEVSEETGYLLQLISNLDDNQRKKINIHLLPLEKCQADSIDTLLQNYGEYADSLTFNENVENDEHFKKLTKNCFRLNALFVKSNKITKISNLPNLITLDCSECRALKELKDLPNLITLDCSGCRALKELKDLPNLETLNCSGCDALQELKELLNLITLNCSECSALQELKELPNLETLNCWWCSALQELKELPNLITVDCSWCSALKELKELPNLTTLKCSGCSALQELKELPNLITVDCDLCRVLTRKSRFFLVLPISFIGEERSLKLATCLGLDRGFIKGNVIDYFNSEEDVTISEGGLEKQMTKGELRKRAFREFPFLFDLLYQELESRHSPFPEDLKQGLDSGNIWNVIKNYYQLNPKTLQKVPLSTNVNLSSAIIIQMLQKGYLKQEWLPEFSEIENIQSFVGNSQNDVWKEQQAFCDVIEGCFPLVIHLGFQFYRDQPEEYPGLLLELIKNTSKASKGKWSQYASRIHNTVRGHERDAVDDFIKTIFLPYLIHTEYSEYQPNMLQNIMDQRRLGMVTDFLKGVHLAAISELSSRWHEPGRAAELNKAKTFSNEAWEPLFSSPVSYGCEGGGSTQVIPLTTSAELMQEGKELGHCVGGYTNACLQENSHILSIRDSNGKPLSTIELQLLPGNGSEEDINIINIEGERDYHLKLIQHYGYRNRMPPKNCIEISERLFADIRQNILEVYLSQIEKNRKVKVNVLRDRSDIILIGYDPKSQESFNNAKEIYREHGFGSIACAQTFRSNFDALTGCKNSVRGKKKKGDNKKTIQFIQDYLNENFGKGELEVGVDLTRKKPYGAVTLKPRGEFELSSLEELFGKLEVESDVIITCLTPLNAARWIKERGDSK